VFLWPRLRDVAGVDDDETASRGKELLHVSVKDVVFYKVVDDVEREGEFGCGLRGKTVHFEEALGEIL